ncbi:hypothetical protein M8J75_014119 [Diaphorina citri]|nr:hypothetical protein M8J75_014119 [Diaphorina citri]KAI5724674.1 hypothetical protein M8J77_005773 [Diaphorina citri]
MSEEEPEIPPEFASKSSNVSVALGREAILDCPIRNLGRYRVGWMRADDQTILTLHTRVVTHSTRVSINHDQNTHSWRLHIRGIKASDEGCYMCQINYRVMMKHLACIDVLGE